MNNIIVIQSPFIFRLSHTSHLKVVWRVHSVDCSTCTTSCTTRALTSQSRCRVHVPAAYLLNFGAKVAASTVERSTVPKRETKRELQGQKTLSCFKILCGDPLFTLGSINREASMTHRPSHFQSSLAPDNHLSLILTQAFWKICPKVCKVDRPRSPHRRLPAVDRCTVHPLSCTRLRRLWREQLANNRCRGSVRHPWQ